MCACVSFAVVVVLFVKKSPILSCFISFILNSFVISYWMYFVVIERKKKLTKKKRKSNFYRKFFFWHIKHKSLLVGVNFLTNFFV